METTVFTTNHQPARVCLRHVPFSLESILGNFRSSDLYADSQKFYSFSIEYNTYTYSSLAIILALQVFSILPNQKKQNFRVICVFDSISFFLLLIFYSHFIFDFQHTPDKLIIAPRHVAIASSSSLSSSSVPIIQTALEEKNKSYFGFQKKQQNKTQ